MVSCTTGVGIKELQEKIHHAAISAVDYDTKEHIIGMQVRLRKIKQAHAHTDHTHLHPCAV